MSDIIMQNSILNVDACGIHSLAYSFRVICAICTVYLSHPSVDAWTEIFFLHL